MVDPTQKETEHGHAALPVNYDISPKRDTTLTKRSTSEDPSSGNPTDRPGILYAELGIRSMSYISFHKSVQINVIAEIAT